MSYVPSQLFEVVLHGLCLGIPMDNVFHYAPASGASPYSGVGQNIPNNFRDIVVAALRSIVTGDTFYTGVSVTERFPGAVLATTSIVGSAGQGTRSSETTPAFVAWEFKSDRKSRSVRSGFKRFSGVGEGDIAGGIAVSGILAALATVSTNMRLPLNVSDPTFDTNLYPVVVSEVLNGVVRTTPLAELADNWLYHKVTSQASRK